MVPRVLTIAGSDCSGGAGIQADIKTITVLGGYAMSAITAITVQDTRGVMAVTVLSPELVCAQIDACLDDIGVDAIKIGMLGSAPIASAVAARLARLAGRVPIVFDPVMIASSGDALSNAATIDAFTALMPLAALITPNAAELDALGGAEAIAQYRRPWIAKGGDLPGEVITDVLHQPGVAPIAYSAPRIATRHSHGTGCTLASAIATELGRGLALSEAIERARSFVRAALQNAPGFGKGAGPMGHAQAGITAPPPLQRRGSGGGGIHTHPRQRSFAAPPPPTPSSEEEGV